MTNRPVPSLWLDADNGAHVDVWGTSDGVLFEVNLLNGQIEFALSGDDAVLLFNWLKDLLDD